MYQIFFLNEKRATQIETWAKNINRQLTKEKKPKDQSGCAQGLKLTGNRRKAHFNMLSFYHESGKDSSLV